jgi:hypothetical protein
LPTIRLLNEAPHQFPQESLENHNSGAAFSHSKGQKATSLIHQALVRTTPETGHLGVRRACQQRASNGLSRCKKIGPCRIWLPPR